MDEKPDGSAPWDAFGTYLRAQRHLAQLSLRQLADLTKVSNPYLSQIERGLHQPSIAIIKSLAEALNLSVQDLLAHAADIASSEEAADDHRGGDPRATRSSTRHRRALCSPSTDPWSTSGPREAAEPAANTTDPRVAALLGLAATPKKPAAAPKKSPGQPATPSTPTDVDPTP